MLTFFQLKDETPLFGTNINTLPEIGEAINLVDDLDDPNTNVTTYTVIAKGRFFVNDNQPNEYMWKITIAPVVQNP